MQNNRFPAEILPQKYQLDVLPLDSGATLLLSTGPQGELFLTREAPHPALGWQREDIAADVIARDLPGASCRRFASARAVQAATRPGEIHLAMVVDDGQRDHLYLSMGNPASGGSWTAAPSWTACPFDGPAGGRLRITDLRISDASDDRLVIVVADVVAREAAGRASAPAPYAVRLGQDGKARWERQRGAVRHGAAHALCVGRSRNGGNIDGLYASTRIDGTLQLSYTPLANLFHPELAPQVRRLELPGKLGAEVMATCRNPDNTTDLYAIARGTLFYFSATNQGNRAQALPLVAAPLFDRIRCLFATMAQGQVTLWGLNDAGQVIHTSVDEALAAEPSAWSAVRIVAEGVQAIAPQGGNGPDHQALFARTPEGLSKLARAAESGGWVSSAIASAGAGVATVAVTATEPVLASVTRAATPASLASSARSAALASAARVMVPVVADLLA